MKKPIVPAAKAVSEKDRERASLVAAFRAFLHAAIVGEQTGQRDRLSALPGPKMEEFCWAMADLPDNTLARELAGAMQAIVRQIEENVWKFRPPKADEKQADAETAARSERIQKQLDFALALILRSSLDTVARLRASETKSVDLLLAALRNTLGNSAEAVRLARRYEELFPSDSRDESGAVTEAGVLGDFAWDVYQRVEELDRLADEFPEHLALAARDMHAWPMLVHRHTDNRRRFRELADRLQLGADHPLDVSEGARFRPDTPMVRYLEPFIFQMHNLRVCLEGVAFQSAEDEKRRIDAFWWEWPAERTTDEVLELLRVWRRLPPLTKATSPVWAEEYLVPLILATDAREPDKCREPVLQRIWRQKGVKSRGTFKSRLLAAVSAILRRLAREA